MEHSDDRLLLHRSEAKKSVSPLSYGQEEEPIVALARLCEAFPGNAKWMKWYSAIVLHTKYYQEAGARLDAPYNVLPAGVYRESEAPLSAKGKSGRHCERRTAMPWAAGAAGVPLVASITCGDFRSGLSSAATPAFCCRRPRRFPRRRNCAAISKLKNWRSNRPNGWWDEIHFPPA